MSVNKNKPNSEAIIESLNPRLWSEEELQKLYNLGEDFEYGRLFEKNYGVAFKIYELCAENGYTSAYNKLGWFYHEGLGIEKDIDKAYEYYQEGVSRGDSTAMVNLGNMYEFNDFGYEKIDWSSAAKWYLKAAFLGDTKGKFNYANCLHYGNGVKRDRETAFWIFENLARGGDNSVYFYLGLYYQNGWVVKKNIETAIGFYEEGANRGDAYCFANLAQIYSNGINGEDPEYKKAAGYYLCALAYGDALGYAGVAHLFEKGYITGKPEVESAIEWYQLAAQHGFEPAIEELERLGTVYDEGAKTNESALRAQCLLLIDNDCRFDELRLALVVILDRHRCSVPLLQRAFKWGYGHARAVISRLEVMGMVSGYDYAPKKYDILIKDIDEFDKIMASVKPSDS